MRPDDDINDFGHLPTVDEAKLAKQDLWRKAKEAAEIRRAAQAPQRAPAPVASAPPPQQAPAPKRKIKVKLRVPPGARAQEIEEPAPEVQESWQEEPVLETFEPLEEPVYEENVDLAESLTTGVGEEELPSIEEETEVFAETAPTPPAKADAEPTMPTKPAPVESRAEPEPKPKKSKDKGKETSALEEESAKPESATQAKAKEKPATTSDSPDKSEPADGPASSPDALIGPVILLDANGHPVESPEDTETRIKRFWEKIGGRSLALSVGIHLVLFLIAGFVYLSYTENQRIDFLPGGGTQQGEQASQVLENQVTRKKTRWLNKKLPMQRIVVETSMSSITLPDAKPELLDLPMNKDFLGAGKMGSLGFGKSGAGGGFGSGIGVGGKSGVTFTPLSMFGKKIEGRRIAVVLDVSRSMTDYLEGVVKELDRVAAGSPVILYYGCGLLRPGNEKIDETTQRTQVKDFERFWRIWQGDNAMLGFSGVDLKKVTFPANEKIPRNDLYRFFARRNNTWFLDYNGMDYAWSALLCQEIRNADAIFWFADFEDNVDERQMKTVLDNMLVRRQRLYIHPQTHGSSFNKVVQDIVEPSGGDVVEPKKGK